MSVSFYSLYKKWYSQKKDFTYYTLKVCAFGTMLKRNDCSFSCFFSFVNQELCHILRDYSKSRVPLFVCIVQIVIKVSINETVRSKLYYEDNNHRVFT